MERVLIPNYLDTLNPNHHPSMKFNISIFVLVFLVSLMGCVDNSNSTSDGNAHSETEITDTLTPTDTEDSDTDPVNTSAPAGPAIKKIVTDGTPPDGYPLAMWGKKIEMEYNETGQVEKITTWNRKPKNIEKIYIGSELEFNWNRKGELKKIDFMFDYGGFDGKDKFKEKFKLKSGTYSSANRQMTLDKFGNVTNCTYYPDGDRDYWDYRYAALYDSSGNTVMEVQLDGGGEIYVTRHRYEILETDDYGKWTSRVRIFDEEVEIPESKAIRMKESEIEALMTLPYTVKNPENLDIGKETRTITYW